MALKHERKEKDSNCPEEDVCEQFVHQQYRRLRYTTFRSFLKDYQGEVNGQQSCNRRDTKILQRD